MESTHIPIVNNKVGAIAVKCHCIYCSGCLVAKEVLYRPEDIITREQALELKCRCVSCGCLLSKEGQRKGEIARPQDSLKKGPVIGEVDNGRKTLAQVGITKDERIMFRTK